MTVVLNDPLFTASQFALVLFKWQKPTGYFYRQFKLNRTICHLPHRRFSHFGRVALPNLKKYYNDCVERYFWLYNCFFYDWINWSAFRAET